MAKSSKGKKEGLKKEGKDKQEDLRIAVILHRVFVLTAENDLYVGEAKEITTAI